MAKKEKLEQKDFLGIQKDSNEKAIAEATLRYINDNEGLKYPTLKDISEITGLSMGTVHKYYQGMKFTPAESIFRNLTPYVVNHLFNLTKSNPSACKLWFQVVEGWSENDNTPKDNILNITHTIVS